WAVYLLPKALRHHDEEDRRRSVEEFSDAVRVVGRGFAPSRPPVVEPAETPAARVQSPAPSTLTRQAAAEAAQRRRRVLALLISMLAVVTVTSYLSYTPWLTTAIPTVLIVAFLVVARLTVRAQQAVRRSAPVQHTEDAPARKATEQPAQQPVLDVEADLDTEDTQGLSRDELAEVVGEPVLDEGGLWDPLPVTLPTYVNKARARRTVRTIELTASTTGITSAGHDAADSALAREAEALQAEVEAEVDVVETPKAAGA
ncbi:MAG: hypothetical protein ACJ72O_15025, partial [Marmoricola sp.]